MKLWTVTSARTMARIENKQQKKWIIIPCHSCINEISQRYDFLNSNEKGAAGAPLNTSFLYGDRRGYAEWKPFATICKRLLVGGTSDLCITPEGHQNAIISHCKSVKSPLCGNEVNER